MTVAAILVGGFGTRLRSVVSDVPKPLAPIHGKPFIFFLLEELAKLSVKRVILLTGYMHDKVVAACGDGTQFGLEIIYSQEHEALGTAGAVKLAEPLLAQESDFLLLNGDSLCQEALAALVPLKCSDQQLGFIAVSYVADASRFGTVKFAADSKTILAFQEKAASQSGYVNAGVYRLSSKIFNVIQPNQKLSLEQDIFPKHVNNGLLACEVEALFDDIGLPESYLEFQIKQQEK